MSEGDLTQNINSNSVEPNKSAQLSKKNYRKQ